MPAAPARSTLPPSSPESRRWATRSRPSARARKPAGPRRRKRPRRRHERRPWPRLAAAAPAPAPAPASPSARWLLLVGAAVAALGIVLGFLLARRRAAAFARRPGTRARHAARGPVARVGGTAAGAPTTTSSSAERRRACTPAPSPSPAGKRLPLPRPAADERGRDRPGAPPRGGSPAGPDGDLARRDRRVPAPALLGVDRAHSRPHRRGRAHRARARQELALLPPAARPRRRHRTRRGRQHARVPGSDDVDAAPARRRSTTTRSTWSTSARPTASSSASAGWTPCDSIPATISAPA